MTAQDAKDDAIRRFRIGVPQAALDDLSKRLAQTRWPDDLPGTGWDYGPPEGYLKAYVEYWNAAYDWRKHEAALNAFPQFTTTIDDANVHFIHVRSPEPDARPLMLIHGWPGSIAEFIDMIGPLSDPRRHGSDPAEAFHIIVPSIPGYGFSGPTTERGWSDKRVAAAFAELMRRLGYERYGVHGGDMGSIIGRTLGMADQARIVGVHVLQAFAFPSGAPGEMDGLNEEDYRRLARLTDFQRRKGAYAMLQSTRPHTLAYGLTDSPVGQLAWSLDFMANCGDTVDVLSRDHVLTNVMMYWLTGTAGSSGRFYYENANAGAWGEQRPSSFPMGVAVFPDDFLSIRRFAERDNQNIVHWSEFDKGGHFAALEQPDLLIGDLRDFFRALR
jgi:pimeloyl-ACP methyl ester carboxylesterase